MKLFYLTYVRNIWHNADEKIPSNIFTQQTIKALFKLEYSYFSSDIVNSISSDCYNFLNKLFQNENSDIGSELNKLINKQWNRVPSYVTKGLDYRDYQRDIAKILEAILTIILSIVVTVYQDVKIDSKKIDPEIYAAIYDFQLRNRRSLFNKALKTLFYIEKNTSLPILPRLVKSKIANHLLVEPITDSVEELSFNDILKEASSISLKR